MLGAAGLICKIVGVLYRIPLANMIGGDGLGLYQQVMPAYNLLLAVTSADANETSGVRPDAAKRHFAIIER